MGAAQFFQPLFESRRDVCNQAFPRSEISDRPIQLSGVYAADAHDSEPAHDVTEGSFASEIGRLVIVFVYDQRADRGNISLIVLIGHAVVADQRIGHDDGLVCVGRIREDLLVTDHGSVEYDLQNLVLHVAKSEAAVF